MRAPKVTHMQLVIRCNVQCAPSMLETYVTPCNLNKNRNGNILKVITYNYGKPVQRRLPFAC